MSHMVQCPCKLKRLSTNTFVEILSMTVTHNLKAANVLHAGGYRRTDFWRGSTSDALSVQLSFVAVATVLRGWHPLCLHTDDNVPNAS